MKLRGRHTRGQHAAGAAFVTADLFADGHAGTGRDEARPAIERWLVPEAMPPGIASPPLPPAMHPLPQASLKSLRLAGGVPTPPRTLVRPSPKQLWYAAVFPELREPRAAVMQRLCLSAQQFTSLVSLEMPNALLLDIKGSVKLFGSPPALHCLIDAVWNRLALHAHTAIAPTTLAALWLARAGKQVCIEDPGVLAGGLAELPIACTCWNLERLQTLRSMGVSRIGELLRLPRAGIARRLSPDAVMDLDIALARQSAPRRAFVPRERFFERFDFETEIATVGYLQKAVEPLIERCAQFLRERQAGVQGMELKLRHRVIPATRVRVGLASITSERRRLADVLDGKLERLELPAPVRGMELLSGSLRTLSGSSLDAFAGLRGDGRDTAPQLVERLRARLGEESVYGVVPVPEHRPEAAWQRVHELSPAVRLGDGRMHPGRGKRDEQDHATHDMPRPVWLLAEPALLCAADLQQLQRVGLLLEEGPERIESGWWDGKGVARDYYIARRPQGARWWVFQERHTHDWYLHGVFA